MSGAVGAGRVALLGLLLLGCSGGRHLARPEPDACAQRAAIVANGSGTPAAESGEVLRMVDPGPVGAQTCVLPGLPQTATGPLRLRPPVLHGLGRQEAEALAAVLDAAPLAPSAPPGAAVSCPADTSADALVRFAYADGRRRVVLVHPGGCARATNGRRLAVVTDAMGRALGFPPLSSR